MSDRETKLALQVCFEGSMPITKKYSQTESLVTKHLLPFYLIVVI